MLEHHRGSFSAFASTFVGTTGFVVVGFVVVGFVVIGFGVVGDAKTDFSGDTSVDADDHWGLLALSSEDWGTASMGSSGALLPSQTTSAKPSR